MAVVMHVVKVGVYGRYSLLGLSSIAVGLAISVVMTLGAYIGSRVVKHLPERVFHWLIEAVLLVSELQFLIVRKAEEVPTISGLWR